MSKSIMKILAVAVCVVLVSCTNTGNVDTETEAIQTDNGAVITTEITELETVTEKTPETTELEIVTEKTSIFDGIDEKYINRLVIEPYGDTTFAEILENAEEGELFKVCIDLINNVDLSAAEAYASSCGLPQISDEYQRLRRNYIKDYNRSRENALVEKYNIELTDESALGIFAPYISNVCLTLEIILEIVQEPEVATITYHDPYAETMPFF